ncbi:MAG TPA: trimeric intracellular cation channel family protein [Longimicrobiales bacterium]|nr:trimeric intracellular cation channel family protein [Longimicrobiales bacterium]
MTLYLLDLAGVAVFAVSGVLAAGRKKLDLFGVVVLAIVTAIGGGTLRDVLMDRGEVFWMTDPTYLVVITSVALLTVAWVRRRRPPEHSLEIADAAGLSFFVVSGGQIALDAGLPAVSILVVGMMTGVAGGAIRDILTAEIPFILRHRQLYATAALAGVGLWLGLETLGVATPVASLAGMALTFTLRLLSIYRGLRVPVFDYDGR